MVVGEVEVDVAGVIGDALPLPLPKPFGFVVGVAPLPLDVIPPAVLGDAG